MKIKLWSIGKAPEVYIQTGVDDYLNRLNHYFSSESRLITGARQAANLSAGEIKKQEAESVTKLLSKKDYLVVLDENGRQFSSEELAAFIETLTQQAKDVVFLIGGAFGVDDSIKKRADLMWSLSKLVFPHALARLIVAEQLYRAATIIQHEKYHHK